MLPEILYRRHDSGSSERLIRKGRSMLEYNTTFIAQRADPYIIKSAGGTYYFTASVPAYDGIYLRASGSLEGLKEAKEKQIWHKHEDGPQSIHIWAPELHMLDGGWYIYYSGGDKNDIWAIRPYVLKCTGPDPMTDSWTECGPMQAAEGDDFSFTAFSLDATVFEDKGRKYYVWAEKVGTGKQISNLYIAEMESPFKLKTVQKMISTPDYGWERHGFWVNEGPSVIRHGGKLYLTYSASDTGPAYCMGMLTADENSDLLDPASWVKSHDPVLMTDEEKRIYGPGHNSFTEDVAGDPVMVYHARTEAEITGDPLYNPNRHAMLMKIKWDQDGAPVFGFD